MGGDFDEFIVLDEVDRLLEGECTRGGVRMMFSSLPEARTLVSCLPLVDVDDEVVVAVIFADDHPFIDFIARSDKERAALLKAEAGIAGGFAGAIGDEDAALTAGDVSFPRAVAVEDGGEDAKSAGDGQEVVAVAHQSAGRDEEFDGGDVVLVGVESAHFSFSAGELFDDSAGKFLRHFDMGHFIGSCSDAIDFFDDDLRFGDGEFIVFAAHRFDEDGEVKFASSADADRIVADAISSIFREILALLSWLRRSRSLFIVTCLPSFPTKGPLLTMISIERVGSAR